MSTPNIPPGGAQSYAIAVQLSGSYTADTPNVSRLRLNGRHMVLGLDAFVRASSGDGQSCAVDLTVGGQSLLAAPLAITAAAGTSATMVNLSATGGPIRPRVADEGVLSFGLTIGGTNPAYRDITLTVHLART